MTGPPEGVTVCVVTRERPAQLGRLLDALAQCEVPSALPWIETLVVDNDRNGSARASVEAARPGFPTPLRHVIEPEPGVSAARNTAVAAAGTQFIAFIDDDMTPHPAWLANLTRGAIEHDAHAAIGPVPIRFESEPPRGLAESGALDFPDWKHGESIDTLRTGNVILDRSVLSPAPFDLRLATSGGEDHMLGRQLSASERRIIFLEDAVADEWTPPDRLTPKALRARQRRLGYAYAKVDLVLSAGGTTVASRATHLATGLARIAVGVMLSLPFLGPIRRWRGHRLRWFGIGQLIAVFGPSLSYYR